MLRYGGSHGGQEHSATPFFASRWRRRDRAGHPAPRRSGTNGGDDGHVAANEIGGEGRQALVPPLRPAILDRYVASDDNAGIAQTTMEVFEPERGNVGCSEVKEAHDGHRLLPVCDDRPSDGRTAEQRDELASDHSMTSSARARSVGGSSSPSPLAVCRLMTNSNLVGCSTGMSAGFAPRKILLTKSADRRNRSGTFGP